MNKKYSFPLIFVTNWCVLFTGCNPLGSSSVDNEFLPVLTSGGGGVVSTGGCTAGTAAASDVLSGATFPDGSGGMTTGTMTNVGAFNLTGAFSAGYVSSLTGLAASSVCSTTLDGSLVIAAAATLDSSLMIGNQSAGGRLLSGDMAEVIVYSSALSDTDRGTIECYLSNKYALGLSGC